MGPSNALTHVFNAASALDFISGLLVECGDDAPPISSAGLGHILKLLERDLAASCTELLDPN